MMKTRQQEAEFSPSKWDEPQVSSFRQEDGQRSWKLNDQLLKLALMFPHGFSSFVPLDELNVLQNPPNEQPHKKVNHSA